MEYGDGKPGYLWKYFQLLYSGVGRYVFFLQFSRVKQDALSFLYLLPSI